MLTPRLLYKEFISKSALSAVLVTSLCDDEVIRFGEVETPLEELNYAKEILRRSVRKLPPIRRRDISSTFDDTRADAP